MEPLVGVFLFLFGIFYGGLCMWAILADKSKKINNEKR